MVQKVGKDVKIGKNVRINVSERFEIGDRSIINDNVLIEGRYIEIGKEAWIDEHAHIGGGSCFDWQSNLIAGDFLHMGKFSHINTARKVKIGDECGIGIGTKIFTHGAYLSAFDGFPVKFASVEIGDRVWLPHAWVNPGVRIGNDVVIAAMSLVNTSLPSGCLAGGIPIKVIRENVYPRELNESEKINLVNNISQDIMIPLRFESNKIIIKSGESTTMFDLQNRTIEGSAIGETERLKNQLRRYGIRFRYCAKDGVYVKW